MREPVSIVKPWNSVMESAATNVRAEAATGEPDRTRRAPSQPRPNVEAALRTRNPWSFRTLRLAAPVFMIWRAPMNRKSASRKRSSHQRALIVLAAGVEGGRVSAGAVIGAELPRSGLVSFIALL